MCASSRACSPSAAQHLPIFFDGLFHMLADPNKEIRQQTFSVLQEFLREIRDAESVAYAPIVHVLVQHSASQDKFSRLSAISWLHTFVSHGREKILPFCAQVLNAILSSLSHSEEEIREAAGRADNTLRTLLQQSQDAQFDMQTLLHALSSHLASQYVPTLVASLEWVHMLLRKSASRVMQLSQQIWPALFGCLTNASEEVVRLDIEALARMAPNQLHFTPLIDHLLKLFKSERNLLEGRGALIVRQLCVLLDPHNVFETLAGGLEHEEDLDFASQMIQMLNLILLTSQVGRMVFTWLSSCANECQPAWRFLACRRRWSSGFFSRSHPTGRLCFGQFIQLGRITLCARSTRPVAVTAPKCAATHQFSAC